MSKYNINSLNKIHKELSKQLENYIQIIKKEYGNYLSKEVIDKLNSINNYEDIIEIKDSGTINGYATEKHIILPSSAVDALNKMSEIPGYGIRKNHKTYTSDTIITNNNTFKTYIYHAIAIGMTPKEYYEDLLLHETLHYCGSTGAKALQEGLNELLTRLLAKKYNLKTNACAYPKEVKLCYRLMNIFGEDVMIQLSFISGTKNKIKYLNDTLGEDASLLYANIDKLIEEEFYKKYYNHMHKFKGFKGIFLKENIINE